MNALHKQKLTRTLALCALAMASTQVLALEELVVIGSSADARQLAGSGSVIEEEQLHIEVTADINQVLKTVPGVYIREEDGSGLRPNIGIRGATSERSGKITLMEDGVLIAPGPYSNPAAYYFPATMRMSSVEVLKGAPLLRYGPQTTGGVVNLVSTPIPEATAGKLRVNLDERGSNDLHFNYGETEGQWGWLLETVQRNSDGFKEIDRSDRDTGFDIEDYMVKVGWQSDGSGRQQRLLLKAQYSEEMSNETYTGLTDADFAENPYRRYGLSEIDQMNNHHSGVNLVYSLELSDNLTATATGYYNTFARDWFKFGGANSLIAAANTGDTTAQGVLDGTLDASDLRYTHGNRAYESRGLELNFDLSLGQHALAVGGRSHHDKMDRYQHVEVYDQVNGSLLYNQTIAPVGSNNRLEDADAISFWLTDKWRVTDALRINLAARYENVESSRRQFADADRNNTPGTTNNDTSELLPGASFTYDLAPEWQLLGGVHKGFSPLGGGAKEFEEPETSTNWEAGVRYHHPILFVETIGFYSDFSNKAENCSVGSPCSNGETSGVFITGEAVIAGVEFQASTVLRIAPFEIPLDFTYTYTDAEVNDDNSLIGVTKGDRLKDIPKNMASLRLGLEQESSWNNYLVAKYTGNMCSVGGCNREDSFTKTDSLLVLDYISRYAVKEGVEVFFKVENLLDEQAIVSRAPDGARPNQPRTALVGLELGF